MTQVYIESKAYKKSALHTLQYPTSSVIGVLTGQKNNVSDAFPLFHTPVVNPSLDIALSLVEAQLKEGDSIIGLYHTEPSATELHNCIAQQISKNNNNQPTIFLRFYLGEVDPASHEAELLYELSLSSGEVIANKQHSFSSLESNLVKGHHRVIVDMDAHLENIELDFNNPQIN